MAADLLNPVAAIGSSIASPILNIIGQSLIKRPKYQIQPEVDQNKALGAVAAFGQNPAISMGNAQADQTAAQDVNTAQQYSSSTGQILNTLKAINSNRNKTKQNLAMTDAEMRRAGLGTLMGANKDAIDEYDKAWNYNENQPYQNQISTLRETTKGVPENFWRIMDATNAGRLLKTASL